MACRVGTTSFPDERKAYWENQVYGFKNWQILDTAYTYERAQYLEKYYALQYRCTYHPGGADGGPPYSIYYFEYTREK